MTIEKNQHGAYVVSEIIYGYLFSRTYYGYTKKDAIKTFKKEKKNGI